MNTQQEDVHELIPNQLGEFVKFQGIKNGEIPQRTFFYEQVEHEGFTGFIDAPEEKKIIAVSESEAVNLKPHKWRQIGASDGKAYISYLQNCGVKRGEQISVEKARQIMKGAFDAELAAAKGNFQRPRRNDFTFGGASQGTQGVQDFINGHR